MTAGIDCDHRPAVVDQCYGRKPLLAAVANAARLYANRTDAEFALAFNLTFELFEQRTFKFLNAPALQAGQVDVLTRSFRFIVVLPAFQVHQVQFIDKSVSFKQGKGSIDGNFIKRGILIFGALPEGDGVKV